MADSPGNRKEPLTTFLFGLKITGPGQPKVAGLGADRRNEALPKFDYTAGTAFFKSISGLSFKTDAQDAIQGGNSVFTHKLIGPRKWDPLILKQGFTGDMSLWNWRCAPSRVNGTIYALGAKMQVICSWSFVNGYPSKWEGPDLDASKNELAIETIEIVHEGLVMTTGSGQTTV
jgi:phage tail-like protein